MIRVRRVKTPLPWAKKYEVELQRRGEPGDRLIVGRGSAVRALERIVGVGDAWSFINQADREWDAGSRTWAVEYEEAAS